MSGQELTTWAGEGSAERPGVPPGWPRSSTGPLRHGHRPPRAAAGFTLIELMIVVVVIGILAAIAIPNFIAMQARAKEGSVKANMHTVQMSVEDFALMNDGLYPTSATATVPDGRTLAQVCPTGAFPKNPFTKASTIVRWNTNPATGHPGELGLNPALTTNYVVKGNGAAGDTMGLMLTSGQ